jgi:glycosyltransferase involved in cell wall biosynthesis
METTSPQSASALIANFMHSPGVRWDFITSEFPPKVGGLSDYSRQLAEGLCRGGAKVDVWAPGMAALEKSSETLTIRRVFDRFRPTDLVRVSKIWKTAGVRRNIFLQWCPTGYGYKSLNIFLCFWLAWQVAQGHLLTVMFHEVAYSLSERKLRLKIAGIIHRIMAIILLKYSRQVFVSTATIAKQLRKYNLRQRNITVLPVPSNVPECINMEEVRDIRSALVTSGELLIGHFGLYSPGMERILIPGLDTLLSRNFNMKVIFIGNGSERYRSNLLAKHPELDSRVFSTGSCSSARVSEFISACDCIFQPYPDGVTTKRGSAMAAVANGKLLVCTASDQTEEVWKTTPAVCLIHSCDPMTIAIEAEQVISTPERRLQAALDAQRFYQQNFSVDHTVKALQLYMETVGYKSGRHAEYL